MSEKMPTWSRMIENAPGEWVLKKFGDLLLERVDTAKCDLPLLSVTASRGVVYRDSLNRRDTSSEDKSKYKHVLPGDIVYNTMRMWQGVSGISCMEGIVSPAYTVMAPSGCASTEFISHLFKFPPLVAVFKARSQGLVADTLSLRFGELARIAVRVPPLAEQRKIAAVLSLLDETIEKTEMVVEKLSALWFCVGEEFLSRGCLDVLDETVAEDFLERWETVSVGEVAVVSYGLTINRLRRESSRRFPYLSVANLQRDRINLVPLKEIGVLPGDLERYQLKRGDILVVEGNANPDRLGCAAVWKDEVPNILHQNHLIRIRPDVEVVDPRWLALAINSKIGRRQIQVAAKTSSGLHTINSRVVTMLRVPLPELSQQIRVCDALAAIYDRIDVESSMLKALLSMKSALATRLLTGQIRVTPDEAPS